MAPSTLRELCHFWFQAYHPWFPVLHEPSIMDALQTTLPRPDSALTIVFKAIAAVTIVHSFASRALSLDERQKVSTSLRNEVVMQAMGNLSLPCLQSILILTIVDCGAGKLVDFWNLVALCKRLVLLSPPRPSNLLPLRPGSHSLSPTR